MNKQYLSLSFFLCSILLLAACGGGCKSDKGTDGETEEPTFSPTTASDDEAIGQVERLFQQPLADTNQTQVFAVNDELTIRVPPGVAPAGQPLTVDRLADPPPFDRPGMVGLPAYDIRIGKQQHFDKPLTVELAYKPDTSTEQIEKSQPPDVAWWDARQDAWVRVPSKYDPQRGVVVFQTDHLSVFRLWAKVKGYHSFYEVEIDGQTVFGIAYHLPDFDPVKSPGRVIYKGDPANAKVPGYIGVPDYVRDTTIYLAKAWNVYSKSFTNPDSLPIGVLIGTESANYRARFTGWIKINLNATSPLHLKLNTGHEMFHAFQAKTLNLINMSRYMWQVESAAEYGAGRFVWSLNNMGSGFSAKFPFTQLTHVPKMSDPDTLPGCDHEYHSAYFVEYFLKHTGMEFPEYWKLLAKQSADPLAGLAGVLKVSKADDLDELYTAFAQYWYFDPSAPTPGNTPGTISPAAWKGYEGVLKHDQSSIERVIGNNANHSARLWKVRRTFAAGEKTPGTLAIQTDKLPEGVRVFVAYARNDKRPLDIREMDRCSPVVSMKVSPKDAAYVLIINNAPKSVIITLRASRYTMKFEPDPILSSRGTKATFRVKASEVPKGANFVWTFGDSTKKVRTQKPEVTHEYAKENTFYVMCAMMAPDGSKLAVAGATAIVGPLAVLQNFQHINLFIEGSANYRRINRDGTTKTVTEDFCKSLGSVLHDGSAYPIKKLPITWHGTTFQVTGEHDLLANKKLQPNETKEYRKTIEISGEVDPSGKKILWLKVKTTSRKYSKTTAPLVPPWIDKDKSELDLEIGEIPLWGKSLRSTASDLTYGIPSGKVPLLRSFRSSEMHLRQRPRSPEVEGAPWTAEVEQTTSTTTGELPKASKINVRFSNPRK